MSLYDHCPASATLEGIKVLPSVSLSVSGQQQQGLNDGLQDF